MRFHHFLAMVGVCAATVAGSASDAAAASTLSATLQVTTTWQGNPGYCAIVVVTNSGSTPWKYSSATFDVGVANIYTSWWNSTLQGTTGRVTITNNAPIMVQPGTSNSNNGFCAMGAVPSNLTVTLNALGTVSCGTQSCDLTAGNYCCASGGTYVSPATYSCQASACASNQINMTCTVSSGCPSGEYCWFAAGTNIGMSTSCSSAQGQYPNRCNATFCSFEYCSTDADCGGTFPCINGSCGTHY